MIQRMVETGRKYLPRKGLEIGLVGAGGVTLVGGVLLFAATRNFEVAIALLSSSSGAIATGASMIKNRVKEEERVFAENLEMDRKTLSDLNTMINSSGVLPEERRDQLEKDVREGRKLAKQSESEKLDFNMISNDTSLRLDEHRKRIKDVLNTLGVNIGDRDPIFPFHTHLKLPTNSEISYQVEILKQIFTKKGLGIMMKE